MIQSSLPEASALSISPAQMLLGLDIIVPGYPQGWEERVDAAMIHLLRTSLAKVAKDSVSGSASGHPPLTMPEDTKKMKKHISIVFDRLSKGARLTSGPTAVPTSSLRISAN